MTSWNSAAPILWVRQQSPRPPDSDDLDSFLIEFCFEAAIGEGYGESAKEIHLSEREALVAIDASARSCSGGFSQQALNRIFVRHLLRLRPSVVVVEGFFGCTLDLPRLCYLAGLPCAWVLSGLSDKESEIDSSATDWFRSALASCEVVVGQRDDLIGAASLQVDEMPKVIAHGALRQWIGDHVLSSDVGGTGLSFESCGLMTSTHAATNSFDYSLYEFLQRDHPLLTQMQAPDARHFQGLNKVLDVGCGAGIFLDILRQQGIPAMGVERNATVAEYGRGMGLDIHTEDALTFLATTQELFDGLYCSHFVEHLPIDKVEELLSLLEARLQPGGVLVLVFPDPESIRSQLLGFWRDPEHVRFYHPQLIAAMAACVGLQQEWSSYDEQPHEVFPFAVDPSPLPPPEDYADRQETRSPVVEPRGLLEKLLGVFGLASTARVRRLEQQFEQLESMVNTQRGAQYAINDVLAERTQALWQVNQTWAWNDNVTIKLRKPAVDV